MIQRCEEQKRKTNRDELPGSPRGINKLEIHTFVETSINLVARIFSASTRYPSHRARKMGILWKANPVPNVMNSCAFQAFSLQSPLPTAPQPQTNNQQKEQKTSALDDHAPSTSSPAVTCKSGKPLVSTAGSHLLEGTWKNFQLPLPQPLTV